MAKVLSDEENEYFDDLSKNFERHVEDYRQKKIEELGQGKALDLLVEQCGYIEALDPNQPAADVLINIRFSRSKLDVLRELLDPEMDFIEATTLESRNRALRLLVSLLDTGIPIVKALDLSLQEVSNQSLRNLLQTIKSRIENGGWFREAIRQDQELFAPFEMAIIGMSESYGSLPAALDAIARTHIRAIKPDEMSTMYRCLSMLHQWGWPAIAVFKIVALCCSQNEQRSGLLRISYSLERDANIADAFWTPNSFFPKPITEILETGRIKGNLFEPCSKLAEAYEAKLLPDSSKKDTRSELLRGTTLLWLLIDAGKSVSAALKVAVEVAQNTPLAAAWNSAFEKVEDGGLVADGIRSYDTIFTPAYVAAMELFELAHGCAEKTIRMLAEGIADGRFLPYSKPPRESSMRRAHKWLYQNGFHKSEPSFTYNQIWSEDQRWLAVLSSDWRVTLYDTERIELCYESDKGNEHVGLEFLQDNTLVHYSTWHDEDRASGKGLKFEVTRHEGESHKVVHISQKDWSHVLGYSTNGRHILYEHGLSQKATIDLSQLINQDEGVYELPYHDIDPGHIATRVRHAYLSPKGDRIVFRGQMGPTHTSGPDFFAVIDGSVPVKQLPQYNGIDVSATYHWSPDGKYIAARINDRPADPESGVFVGSAMPKPRLAMFDGIDGAFLWIQNLIDLSGPFEWTSDGRLEAAGRYWDPITGEPTPTP